MLDFTVSVCHPKHLEVWSVAQENIVRCLSAHEHLLVVPDDSVPDFEAVTQKVFRVEPESHHTAEYEDALRSALSHSDQPERYGWFAQQFIKIGALRGHASSAKLLMWDADTVPLRPINFFDDRNNSGKVGYFSAQLRGHSPMFAQIETLLGLPKATKRGFIAQCFPLWGHWANDFFRAIDDDGRHAWHQKLIKSIPFSRGSALSEYELLGTFIATRYPDKVFWNDLAYSRNGYEVFEGPAEAVAVEQSEHELHFAAFEDYNRAKPTKAWGARQGTFRSTAEENQIHHQQLAQSLLQYEKANQKKLKSPRLFVGLQRELLSIFLAQPELRTAWSDLTVIDPGFSFDNQAAFCAMRGPGIPGASWGQVDLHFLDASTASTQIRNDVLVSHPTLGLIIAPTRAKLAIRFWAELTDWDQQDADMREIIGGAAIHAVDVVPWQAIDFNEDTFVLVHLEGFEDEVIGSLVQAMELGACARPKSLALVSVFEDVDLSARMAALGYDLVRPSVRLDDYTPLLWGFMRNDGFCSI